jgi:hypothetical protein
VGVRGVGHAATIALRSRFVRARAAVLAQERGEEPPTPSKTLRFSEQDCQPSASVDQI